MAIKWKAGDYIRLGKAVSNFNKNISEIEKIENALTPEYISYSDIKERINTRAELNKAINTLKRLDSENYYKNFNAPVPKWNITSLSVAQIQAEKKLEKLTENKEIDNLDVLNAELKRIKELETLEGYQYRRKLKRIKQIADIKYDYKRADTYRKNYIKAIKENFTNMEGYKQLVSKLQSIKNPMEFYNIIKDNGSINDRDIYLFYQGQKQETLNNLLEAWGIDSTDVQTL